MLEDEEYFHEKKERVPSTWFHKLIEIITLFILIIMIIYPFVMWNTLPSKIPAHYNALGEIDRWGTKYELFVLPIVGVFLYGLMSLVSLFPSAWNIPVTVTRENRKRVYQTVKSLLVFMKLEVIVLFGYLEYHSTQMKNMPGSFLGIVLVVLFGTVFYYIARMYWVAKRRDG